MNQAEVGKLMSGLRIGLSHKLPKVKNTEGPRGALNILRETVTALVANERLEITPTKGHMTRLYTERLISEAILHGDKHRETMEVATWWLKDDKAAVHKLFKVTRDELIACA